MICLDVLRALGRSPAGLDALRSELEAAKGAHPAFDRAVNALFSALAKPHELEMSARRVVEKMALCLQAALLVRSSDGPIAEAIITSRLGSASTYTMGTLPLGAPIDRLIMRAWAP